jgi:nucleotide-binding universal stress UspA family protein
VECVVHSIADMLPFAPQHILVPVDFSECSRCALEYAGLLGKKFGAALHVLYVSYIPKELVCDAVGRYEQFDDPDIREARRRLDLAIADLKRDGVATCTAEVVPRLPTEACSVILERANSGRYDLVVMGTHGRVGLQRLWNKSIAERIVRDAHIPVITVRGTHAAPSYVAEPSGG